MYLFYVKEILGVKGDGCGWYWNILIQCATIADVGPYSKCHRFSLDDGQIHSVSNRLHIPVCTYIKYLSISFY